MEITKEYLLSEIASLESELRNAQTFAIQAQAAIDTHRTVLARLEQPENKSNGESDGNPAIP